MSCTASSIKIDPVNVYWQIAAQDCWDFANATASGIGGKYVYLYLPDGTKYYAWFDENNTDTDPAPGGGALPIEVDYAASATASAIASAFASEVSLIAGFTAVANGTVVCVDRDDVGEVTDSTEGNAGTYVDLSICRRGKDFDLGLIDGDVGVEFDPQLLDIKAHQSGTTLRAQLLQGFSIKVTTKLLETTTSKLKTLFKIYGGVFTPSGGTELFGAGSAKIGSNLLVEAARLILKPVNAVDDTTNVVLALAVPKPGTLTFSGENPKTLEVEWTGFQDGDINTKVNNLIFGDQTQDLT